MKAVLDSSANFAYLFGEPGATVVEEALREGVLISTINLIEILSTLSDRGYDVDVACQEMAESGLMGMAIQVIVFDETQALEAARLRASTRRKGLSLVLLCYKGRSESIDLGSPAGMSRQFGSKRTRTVRESPIDEVRQSRRIDQRATAQCQQDDHDQRSKRG